MHLTEDFPISSRLIRKTFRDEQKMNPNSARNTWKLLARPEPDPKNPTRFQLCTGQPPTLAGIQPAELRRNGATLSLARRAMESGHLLHSTLNRPLSANARRLKSRHPFIPAAQHLIFLSDNNYIRAAHWADYQWNAAWTDNSTRLRIFTPDTDTHSPEWSSQEEPGSGLTASTRCRTFPLLFVQMVYGFFCGLWVWRRRTNRRPCWPPMSNPSTSPRTAWPDGSGRWDNWMAAQHLPRDLVRPCSGFNNSLKRRRPPQ